LGGRNPASIECRKSISGYSTRRAERRCGPTVLSGLLREQCG
jgi:hypothetical protein